MNQISSLMTPLTIGDMRISNRIVMAPMTRDFSPGGVPTDDVAGYYRRRAENHVGLIITEGIGVANDAAVDTSTVPVLHGEAALRGWKTVVDEVHRIGGMIVPQLWHQGALRDVAKGYLPDVTAMRPSGIFGPDGGFVSLDRDTIERLLIPGDAMTEENIADVIAAYAKSARNAIDVGFDGIAIHGAHGYLIDNFLWHETNRRSDRWGGDLAARTTFAVEVIKAVREAIGPDKPIIFRFSQWRMQDYKAKLAETPDELAKALVPMAEAGVDVFDGSQRYFDTPVFEGSTLNLGGWAKKLTGKLGMAVGGVGLDQGQRKHHIATGAGASNNLGAVVARFERGEFDLIGVGRALLNDPAWVTRAMNNQEFLPYSDDSLARLT